MKKIFISYSHKDAKDKDRLMTHLGALEKQGQIVLWDDEKIKVGDDWQAEIEKALSEVRAAVLLVSADFLNSDFIISKEVPILLEHRAEQGLRIIPVIIGHCAWQKVQWLNEIQAINITSSESGIFQRGLSKLDGYFGKTNENDKAFAEVADQIIEALELDSQAPPSPIQKSSTVKRDGAAINTDIPVFIEIKKENNKYSGKIYQGNRDKYFKLSDINLDNQVRAIPDHDWTLENLVQAIIGFNSADLKAFDERVQLDLGQYLYDQTLGQLPEEIQYEFLRPRVSQVRIVSKDEWILRLPWNLLANQGMFLSMTGWSVSVSGKLETCECLLPPSPRFLIIAPEPAGVAKTGAKDHIEELEDMLSSHDQLLSFGNKLKVAYTWEEFDEIVKDFQPELIYYYGHGVGDSRKSRLLFATGKNLEPVDKPIGDFANCLRKLHKPPILAYINCCLGDAGGFLGAGVQLGDFIPAVITNRTVAYVSAAQAQAMSLWKNILLRAVSPHKAVASLYAEMNVHEMSTADIRWITPVLHAHYSKWEAKAPTPPDRLTHDPHWYLKIDRESQYDAVIAQTSRMLREQKPRSLVFCWYGQEGQGIEIFHRRLRVELREAMENTFVYQVRPEWPQHFVNYHSSFTDMLCQTFEVNTLEDIPVRVRAESHGTSSKQNLIYVRHEPVKGDKNRINTERLKEYVRWWDSTFVTKLEKKQFALLSVSFIVNDPAAFAKDVQDKQIEEMDTKCSVFRLLNEMGNVAKIDLLRFVQTHNIDLPEDRKDKALNNILKKTNGQYEQTVEELKKLRLEAWKV
jgi:hypothetical protein